MQSAFAHPLPSSSEHISSDPVKKKKKKRSRSDAQIASSDPSTVRDKGKKRKRDEEQPRENIPVSTSPDDIPSDLSKQEKKRRKKGKAKANGITNEHATVPEHQIPTDNMDPSAQASTAAFLSAIVAAAAGAPTELLNAPSAGQFDPQYPPSILPNDQSHFMPLSVPYPPPLPPILDPSSFANMGLPFSDLSFGSNEDVLRALQDLDIAKIANVLKTLGEAAAANIPPLSQYPPGTPAPPPPMFYSMAAPPMPVGQLPAPSNAILGIPPKKPSRSKLVDVTPAALEQHGNPDHAEMLATKWLGASKLAELVRTEGLVYKKGKFSAIEEQCLRDAIASYQRQNDFSEEQLQDIIFPKTESRDKTMPFWTYITAAVPQRPIIAVYHHVRRAYHPLKQQGKWSPEEDVRLKQAVADLGQQWEKVSIRVGRMSSDCRDRYRNHIQNRDIRVAGPWSKEEEEQLTQIVTDMTIKQGKDIDNDVFWGRVSELMGGRRGRQQCRIKWTDALSKTVKNEGRKPRWSQQDAFILVHKVDSLHVRDDTEIDWKTLADPDWNLWSAHTLQRRWLTMKRSIKGYENMSHAETMDILRVKKAHLPLPPSQSTKKRKERKVTSAAAIPDADVMNSADTTRAGSENTAATGGSQPDSESESDSDSSSSVSSSGSE